MSRRSNGLGAVWKRRDAKTWRWAVTLQFNNGKQVRYHGSGINKTIAQKALADAITRHSKGGIAKPDQVTLGEWLDRWLEAKTKTVEASTISKWEGVIRLHIKPTLGSKRLQQITPGDLSNFYQSISKPRPDTRKGREHNTIAISNRTIGAVHGVLYGAFKAALKIELINRNPSEIYRPEIPPQDNAAHAADSWTAQEAGQFLSVAQHDPLYTVFYLMLSLGLRRGEVCGLRWTHIDLEAGRLRIEEARTQLNGRVITTKPKTKKSKRPLKLPMETIEQLKIHKRKYDGHLEALAERGFKPESDWIFLMTEGPREGQPIRPDFVNATLKRLSVAAGVRVLRVHDQRHTYASLARRRGVQLEIIADKLGHARPSFTADVYRHTFEDEHEEAAVNLSELLSAIPRARA